ncbi:MAG: hypothetical protein LBL92_02230, partial [Propionibacteriaceae bacterium]|nr:hypothetical protein [Propionibacteriaceae bacterium]
MVALSGCGTDETSSTVTAADSATVETGSVTVETVGATTRTSEPSPVVMTLANQASLMQDYATVAELADDPAVEAVVRGEVTAYQDVYADLSVQRLLTVRVAVLPALYAAVQAYGRIEL